MPYSKVCRSIVALLLMAAAGCAIHKVQSAGKAADQAVFGKINTKFSIQVVVSDAANQNSPIPLDFVTVEDKKLLSEVAKLSAKDWFDRRVQVERDFPDKIQVVSWEWVPGEHGGPIEVDISKDARGAFLFANYANGGEHRAAVDVKTPVIVSLGADDFSVQRLK